MQERHKREDNIKGSPSKRHCGKKKTTHTQGLTIRFHEKAPKDKRGKGNVKHKHINTMFQYELE